MSEHKAAAAEEPTLFDTAENKGDGGNVGGDFASEDRAKSSANEAAARAKGSAATDGEPWAEENEAVRAANERADRLEEEMAELKRLVETMAASRGSGTSRRGAAAAVNSSSKGASSAARAKKDAAQALAQAVHLGSARDRDGSRDGGQRDSRGGEARGSQGDAARAKGGVAVRDGSSSGDSEARREARARVDAGDDASSSKEPPSPSSSAGQPGVGGGEAELRKDGMMAHLLDSLDAGDDIGHYGRLVFVMVARHFLPHEEVLGWLMKDDDLGEEEAQQMLLQVEQRDYSPPRRDRIVQWQAEQEFPILPEVDDPDSGNVYKNLNFPKEIYAHIAHYREQKSEAGE